MLEVKVLVACTNKNGEADFFSQLVAVSNSGFDSGEHLKVAELIALEKGYKGPFVCFAQDDFKNIAKVVNDLECPIPFTLVEKSPAPFGPIEGVMSISWDGVSVRLDGFSDHTSKDDGGILTYLELWDGVVRSHAYNDINIEDPSHTISFEKAKNSARID